MRNHSQRWIPLNDLQRVMLRWNSLHPYNVFDVVEVLRPVSPEMLRTAAEQVLANMTVAVPLLSDDERAYSPDGALASVSVEVIDSNEDPDRTLENRATAELNRPFRIGIDPVVRLSLLHVGVRCFVGMTYQHWFMDGMAAGNLFRRILARALACRISGCAGCKQELETPDYAQALAPHLNWKARLGHGREAVRKIAARTRVAVPWNRGPEDVGVRVRFLKANPDALERLRLDARTHGVTINDVLMAIAFYALREATAERLNNFWRRNLGICNIVDLRPLSGNLDDRAGVYLGFFDVNLPRVPSRFKELLDLIHRETSRIKAGRFYLASLMAMRALPRVWPWLPPSWRTPIFRAGFRYSAAISNLRFPEAWYGPAWNGLVQGYSRACPLGMMLPLIFGVTTRDDQLTVTMTAQRSGYSESQVAVIAAVVEDFLAAPRRWPAFSRLMATPGHAARTSITHTG